MDNITLGRFEAKYLADPLTGCWVWIGSKDRKGYGQLRVAGKLYYSHRLAYEHYVGPIEDGLEIDHVCRNVSCCNPDPQHLEAVTKAVNVGRGNAASVTSERKRAITRCPQGHPYDEANTHLYEGKRHCRTCMRADSVRRYAARVGRPVAPKGLAKTHCKRGHEFTAENTRVIQPGNRRECLACRRGYNDARRGPAKNPRKPR